MTLLLITACGPRAQPQAGARAPTGNDGSPVLGTGGTAANGNADTPRSPSSDMQPLALTLETIGSAGHDQVYVLPRGEVTARVRVRRGTDALSGDTRWMLDFTHQRTTYRCMPTLGAADRTKLAALAPGGETVLELRCDSIAALNGSPRARLWPGSYRAQIQLQYKTATSGWGNAAVGHPDVRVDGDRAQPPASAPRDAKLGGGRVTWIASSITRRTIAQGTMARPDVPPPVATNLRFVFEIANRGAKPLVVADWELFVVSSDGAVSWDAVVVVPRDWTRVVAPGSSLRVELVDGVFPPGLTKTTGLHMALRVADAAGNQAWIAGPRFDVTGAQRDPDEPPVP